MKPFPALDVSWHAWYSPACPLTYRRYIMMHMKIVPSSTFLSAVNVFLERNGKFREVFEKTPCGIPEARFDDERRRWTLSCGKLTFEGDVAHDDRGESFVCLAIFYRLPKETRRMQSFFCWVETVRVPVWVVSSA